MGAEPDKTEEGAMGRGWLFRVCVVLAVAALPGLMQQPVRAAGTYDPASMGATVVAPVVHQLSVSVMYTGIRTENAWQPWAETIADVSRQRTGRDVYIVTFQRTDGLSAAQMQQQVENALEACAKAGRDAVFLVVPHTRVVGYGVPPPLNADQKEDLGFAESATRAIHDATLRFHLARSRAGESWEIRRLAYAHSWGADTLTQSLLKIHDSGLSRALYEEICYVAPRAEVEKINKLSGFGYSPASIRLFTIEGELPTVHVGKVMGLACWRDAIAPYAGRNFTACELVTANRPDAEATHSVMFTEPQRQFTATPIGTGAVGSRGCFADIVANGSGARTYATSLDRPLTEAAAMASMVNTGMAEALSPDARRVYVVGADDARYEAIVSQLPGCQVRRVAGTDQVDAAWRAAAVLQVRAAQPEGISAVAGSVDGKPSSGLLEPVWRGTPTGPAGVSMKSDVSEASTSKDTSGEAASLKDSALRGRKAEDQLSWPSEEGGAP